MRVLIPAILGTAAALLAACNVPLNPPPPGAGASPYGGRQCFYAGNVSGFRRGAGDTVIINTNARDYYVFRTQSYCASRLDWEHQIALRSRGGNFICSGYDAEMYVPDAVGSAYCQLYDMRKLSPAEVTALRSQRR